MIAFGVLSPVASGTAVQYTITPSSQDSDIKQNAPARNFGTATTMQVQSATTAANRRALVQFDLTGIPAGAKIESANMQLYMGNAPTAGRTDNVHRVTNPWTEGNGTANSGVTWNQRQPGVNWTTAGGDYNTTPTTSLVTGTTTGWKNFDVTPDVQGFVDSSFVNNGWLIKDSLDPGGSTDIHSYRTKENTASGGTTIPTLVVTYVIGTTAIAPTSAEAGAATTFTTTMTNTGGSNSPDQVHQVTFTIPAGYTGIPTIAGGYTVTASGGKTWTVTGLPTGSTGPETITVTASSAADDLTNGQTVQIGFTVMTPWALGPTSWSSTLVGAAGGAYSPAPQTETINGTTLTLSAGGSQTLSTLTLNGVNQTTTGTLGTLTIRDARGTGTGWNTVISSTDFIKPGLPARTISANGFSVPAISAVTTVDGNSAPASYAGSLAGAGFKLLSAALGNGMGEYQVTPSLSLNIPAETYTGAYTATVTETILSGP